MLALTDRAVQAVKELVSASEATTETGGSRVAAGQATPEADLQLSVVSLPAEDDEVIEEHGARLFLDHNASRLLDDKVLDADIEQNRVAFTLAEQTSD